MSQLRFITLEEENAKIYISKLSFIEVKNLVKILNLGNDWYEVDQRIEDHRRQLIDHIIFNTIKPYQKIRNKLLLNSNNNSPKKIWNPKNCEGYKSVVHFIQNDYGSGVNINSQGIILTCAHVVNHSDDDEDSIIGKKRIGRSKIIIFPNGHLYECTCFKILESNESDEDLALLRITKRISFDIRPTTDITLSNNIPYSIISQTDPKKNDPLFCIGNPGSSRFGSVSVSQGKFCGLTISRRRSSNGLGKYMHSCWAFYGFSGAALFNSKGEIVAIHNSWNEFSSMKHAISLPCIRNFVKK